MNAIFVDGGVVGKNPSAIGGTWAYVITEENVLVRANSGVITPSEAKLPAITNNLTELLAAICAMETLPDDYDGVLWTDSLVTWHRLQGRGSLSQVPKDLRDILVHERRKLRKLQYMHLKGHPSREDLERGYAISKVTSARTGIVKEHKYTVSKWNILCDRMCNEAGKKLMQNI